MISGFAFILFRGEWPWDGRSQLADSTLYLLTRSDLRSCSARPTHRRSDARQAHGRSATLWLFSENVTSTGNLLSTARMRSDSQDVGDSGTSAPSVAGQVPLPPRVEHQ